MVKQKLLSLIVPNRRRIIGVLLGGMLLLGGIPAGVRGEAFEEERSDELNDKLDSIYHDLMKEKDELRDTYQILLKEKGSLSKDKEVPHDPTLKGELKKIKEQNRLLQQQQASLTREKEQLDNTKLFFPC